MYVDYYGDSTKDITPLYHAFCLFIIKEYFAQLKCYQLQIQAISIYDTM